MRIRVKSITNAVDDRWTIALELDGQHESMIVGLSDDWETYDRYKTVRVLDDSDAEREIIRVARDARAGRLPSLPFEMIGPTQAPTSSKAVHSTYPTVWLDSIKRVGRNRYHATVRTDEAAGRYEIEFLADGSQVLHAWPDDGVFHPCRGGVYRLTRRFHERGHVTLPCELEVWA